MLSPKDKKKRQTINEIWSFLRKRNQSRVDDTWFSIGLPSSIHTGLFRFAGWGFLGTVDTIFIETLTRLFKR